MRLRFFALAGMLLLSSARGADQSIQLPSPAAPVKNAAELKERIAGANANAKLDQQAKPATPAKPTDRYSKAALESEEDDIQALAERISTRLANLRKERESRPPAPRKKPAPAVAKAAAHDELIAHTWTYEGAGGPSQWGSMNPAWATCANGTRQSPIDIRDGFRVNLDPVQFDYKPTRFSVLDNGHTVQVNLGLGNTITLTGRTYELTQFHFHLPSEERINGKGYPMVLHLVHKDAAGRLAVVALLVEEGEPNEVVQHVWNNLPLEKNDAQIATMPLEPAKLLPERRDYYTYMGSLTTPPCTEGVLWIVMKEPIRLSSQQIAIFARLYPMNARPIQALAGRRIKESN
ncbi:carbonic anhydrase [Paucimonas lemoignei]|uniref:carbonic anhydrase n=1 Tax=Paucimonas lemoignei TaxID=29443 RepID=A0A4V6NXY6_PAULE|nr:carbonic anhydrase family protein [Paucimonas lemoignei]TCS36370.1 carbonic anhydrase [Paucimonas lemoignei]